MNYVKKSYPDLETVLDRVEYINFLTEFLEMHIDGFSDDEDLREEAQLHHREKAELYLQTFYKTDKEDYGIDDVVKDIGIGNFLVYVGASHHNFQHDDEDDTDGLEFIKEIDELNEGLNSSQGK